MFNNKTRKETEKRKDKCYYVEWEITNPANVTPRY